MDGGMEVKALYVKTLPVASSKKIHDQNCIHPKPFV